MTATLPLPCAEPQWTSPAPMGDLYERRRNTSDVQPLLSTFVTGFSPTKRYLLETLVDRLNVLLGLPKGWDGASGARISQSAALTATEWLDRLADDNTVPPQVFPLATGGVQIEWLVAGNSFEVEVSPDGAVGILGTDATGKVAVEGEFPGPDGTRFVVGARRYLRDLSSAVPQSCRVL